MKALVTWGRGTIELAEIEVPEPGAGEVRVKVVGAAVNPVDVNVASGVLHQLGFIRKEGRLGLGWDLAGVVDVVGYDVEGFAPGYRVAGLVAALGTEYGSLAEYVVLPAADLAHVPDGVDLVGAASVSLNALTAIQGIDLLADAEGRSLLVTGAAGSVGGFVLELLADKGWELTGLARESDAEFVTARGATLITQLEGSYDVVYDAAALQSPALALVRPGGEYVSVRDSEVSEITDGVALSEPTEGRKVLSFHVVPDGATLAGLLDQVAAGRLTARVAGTVELADFQTAFDRLAAGGSRGRWVVTP